jgi:hypothetical protein
MTKDPIFKASADQQRELFTRFAREARNCPVELVIGAALNVVVNALRQTYQTRANAERRYDELFGIMKTLLLDHYDSLGRKKGIFPYNQNLEVPLLDLRKNGQIH